MELGPGTLLAYRYRIEARIAKGGIGEVFTAIQVNTLHKVVIKRLLPAMAARPDVRARFAQEATLLERVHSDLVVRLIQRIEHPELGLMLVQEFVDGEPLSALLAARPLTIEEARGLGMYLLRALTALERARVVHADLKPNNILVKRMLGALRPVIIDFGASQLVAVRPDPNAARPEHAIGTLEYLAPEQLLGDPHIMHAADLYAVGAILYRAVSGEHLFGELQGQDLLRRKLNEPAPPLRSGRTDFVAQQLERVVARALERDPACRYGRAEDMMCELLRLEENRDRPLFRAAIAR